jgi:hypothetical protein
MDRINLAYDREKWESFEPYIEHQVSIKCEGFLSIWRPFSFSRRTLLGGII